MSQPCQHGGISDETHDPRDDPPDGAHQPLPDDASEEDAPVGFDRWRQESAVGEVVTSVARGLRNVFAPARDEPVVVASVPGDPPDPDERLRVVLDPEDPTKSYAIVSDPDRPVRHPRRDGDEEPPAKAPPG